MDTNPFRAKTDPTNPLLTIDPNHPIQSEYAIRRGRVSAGEMKGVVSIEARVD